MQPITTFLGADKIITYSFMHYLKKATQYAVKIEKFYEDKPQPNDFIPVENTINALPSDPIKGLELTGNIKFDPYFIGESKALLRVFSAEGGEHQFILTGQTSAPQAQGPKIVPIGKTLSLPFTNPLTQPAEISVRFDNNAFSCGKLNNKINAKGVVQIPITYKPTTDCLPTGRVIITLDKLPPWIYYLQAE
jgi:hypothetical protein